MLFVEQRRGFAIEATHAVDATSCHVDGTVRQLSGNDVLTTMRSASKPFQLAACLPLLPRSLRAQLTEQDLALGTSSHHGEPAQIEALEHLLEKLSCSESELLCGAHPPLHAASAALWQQTGRAPRMLHNNCAGKHAFMVAAARANGFALDYRPDHHPLQHAVAALVAAQSGGQPRTVVDGCGLPCFVLRLSEMARSYASLARVMRKPATTEDRTLADVCSAMRAQPFLMSGSDAFDGWLIDNANVIAKVGAGGLLCIALPEQQLGIAIKIRSGSELVRPAATAALLAQLFPEVLKAELPARHRVVQNVVGREVGAIVTRFEAD